MSRPRRRPERAARTGPLQGSRIGLRFAGTATGTNQPRGRRGRLVTRFLGVLVRAQRHADRGDVEVDFAGTVPAHRPHIRKFLPGNGIPVCQAAVLRGPRRRRDAGRFGRSFMRRPRDRSSRLSWSWTSYSFPLAGCCGKTMSGASAARVGSRPRGPHKGDRGCPVSGGRRGNSTLFSGGGQRLRARLANARVHAPRRHADGRVSGLLTGAQRILAVARIALHDGVPGATASSAVAGDVRDTVRARCRRRPRDRPDHP